MPLTNVWMRDPNRHGEWMPASIDEVDRNFSTTIRADSHMLICNICHQYVIFVKGTQYVRSHFKHNRAEESKECEERSFGNAAYAGPGTMDDLPGLLRLRIGSTRPHLEVGFYPLDEHQLQSLIDAQARITFIGNNGSPTRFIVDRSRFAPFMTTWLPLHLSWAEESSCLLFCWNTLSLPSASLSLAFLQAVSHLIP